MRCTFHGGMCCGIKHIRGFNEPSDMVQPQPKTGLKNEDSFGYPVNTEMDFFTDEAPKETALDRLDRILAFIKKRRPSGIVEVVLAKGKYMNQPASWEKILFDRGFSEINRCKNSNSSNTVIVYHLNIE